MNKITINSLVIRENVADRDGFVFRPDVLKVNVSGCEYVKGKGLVCKISVKEFCSRLQK